MFFCRSIDFESERDRDREIKKMADLITIQHSDILSIHSIVVNTNIPNVAKRIFVHISYNNKIAKIRE